MPLHSHTHILDKHERDRTKSLGSSQYMNETKPVCVSSVVILGTLSFRSGCSVVYKCILQLHNGSGIRVNSVRACVDSVAFLFLDCCIKVCFVWCKII